MHRPCRSYRSSRGPTASRSVGLDILLMCRSCMQTDPTDHHVGLQHPDRWIGTRQVCIDHADPTADHRVETCTHHTERPDMSNVSIHPSAYHRGTPPYMVGGRPARIAARLSTCHLRTASKTQIMPSRRTCNEDEEGEGKRTDSLMN